MTISSSRIRFLDKENKILVQDFSDIGTNVPMTDVETPMTVEAMDAIDEGFRLLQSLQRDLMSIVNALSDENIGRFLIDTLLNNLRLNLPNFPGLAVFINTLRSTNPAAFGGLINALIAEASNSIFDTPSLINIKAGNTQQQVVNIALTNFAKKVQSGQADEAYINRLANYGTGDPYAIKAAVNKLNNDYKYTVNEQEKFKLPTDQRTAKTLVCFLSLSLGYYNYLYSDVKLQTRFTTGTQFITSIAADQNVHTGIIDALKQELARPTLDNDSLTYYAEQHSKVIHRNTMGKLFDLNPVTDAALVSKYIAQHQLLMGHVMTYMKQGLTTVYEPYKAPTAQLFLNNILSRIKANTLVLDETVDPVVAEQRTTELYEELQGYLRSSLLAYLKTGKPSKDYTNVYTLINARNTFVKLALEQRSQLTATQLKTLYAILELFFILDIYQVEGDNLLEVYKLRITSPIITYTKVSKESFFTCCLEYLRLNDRQFYVSYPKDGTTGLLSNMVDKMNQVRVELVLNNVSIRNVMADELATFESLATVLTVSLLQNTFYPITFNNHDLTIYTLYKRDLGKFSFTEEDVIGAL